LHILTDFWLLCFLYNHNGLCEIPEKFSWQTIWDLSEKFQLQEIYRSEETTRFFKTTQFRDNIACISHIFAYFDRFMNFVCFVQSQWALRDLKNFSWQTIWDLSERFQLQEIYRSEEKIRFIKIADFHDNIVYISHICLYFEWFYEICVFCKITMGSARSQKKFLDKQSETCQKDSSYKKSTDLRRKLDLSKSPNFLTI